jgi:superfamily I DNA/RNA helicase/RecB family exonuclease
VQRVIEYIDSNKNLDRLLVLTPNVKLSKWLQNAVYNAMLNDETRTVSFSAGFVRTVDSIAYSFLDPELKLITGPEQAMLIKEICTALANEDDVEPNQVLGGFEMLSATMMKLNGTVEELRKLFDVANEHDINPEKLEHLAAQHDIKIWKDAAQVYAKYRSALREKNYVDHSSQINLASRALDAAEKLDYDLMIGVNYQDFSAGQMSLFIKVAEKSGARALLFGDDNLSTAGFRSGGTKLGVRKQFQASFKVDDSVFPEAYEASNVSEQMEFMLQTVRNKVVLHGYKYSDFAIIARSQAFLSRATLFFDAADVPYNYSSSQIPLRDEPLFHAFEDAVLKKEMSLRNGLFRSKATELLDLEFSPTDNAYEVLWKIWTLTGLAEKWRDNVLKGRRAPKYNHLLDVALAIFNQAEQMTLKSFKITAEKFLDRLRELDFPPDNILRSLEQDSVSFLTPPGAAGFRFKQVFIVDVNDGLWPNLKLRDSVFRWALLDDLLSGRLNNVNEQRQQDQVLQILQSERSMFAAALNCAEEQVMVMAQNNKDNDPSKFFHSFMKDNNLGHKNLASQDALVYSLQSQVQKLKKDYANNKTKNVACTLRYLMQEQVGAANPATWAFSKVATASEKVVGVDEELRLSPSKVETLEQCPLKFALEKFGGTDEFENNAAVGTIVHEVAENVPRGTLTQLRDKLEEIVLREIDNGNLEFATEYEKHTFWQKATRCVLSLANYIESVEHPDEQKGGDTAPPEDIEREKQLKKALNENVTLSGTVDRIEKHKCGTSIVDFKTSNSTKTKEEAKRDAQLLCYQIMYSDSEDAKPIEKVALVYINGSKSTPKIGFSLVEQPAMTDKEQIHDAETRILDAAKQLYSSEISAYRDDAKQCQYCNFKGVCPAQD